MTQQIRTPQEIEALKASWLKDPCWDIENSQGFEAHYEELLAFRKEQDQKWEAKAKERDEARAALVREQTGVIDADIVLSLHTWHEIERATLRAEQSVDAPIMALTAALTRATLLQAAQLKRIADALEEIAEADDGTALINSAKIWGAGE